jgi:oxidase EvaA
MRSHAAETRPRDELSDVLAWIEEIRQRRPVRTQFLPLHALGQWALKGEPLRLVHDTGGFFSVRGIRVTVDRNRIWDQPIIDQREIGILGILTRTRGGTRHYLMQAKVEPGNVNGAQISPTLQATPSNYKRVHRGRSPPYLEYFTGERPARVLIDQPQSEQAACFVGKRNRNIIVETEEDVSEREDFRWITLADIQRLMQVDNLVNANTRSVLSCVPFPVARPAPDPGANEDLAAALAISADPSAPAVNTLPGVVDWIDSLGAARHRVIIELGLDRMCDWELADRGIHDGAGRQFSVVGARFEIPGREVSRWSQPILRPRHLGLIGLIVQKINGVVHALAHADLHPGSCDLFELGPTVARSSYEAQYRREEKHPFLDIIRNPPPAALRFFAIQSDEGGRFFKSQNEHVIVEMPDDSIGAVPEGFVWLTFGQIRALLPRGYFNMEARSVFSCLPIRYDDAGS